LGNLFLHVQMGSLNTTQEAKIEPGRVHQIRSPDSHKRLQYRWLPDQIDSIPIASQLSSINCIQSAQALTGLNCYEPRRFQSPAD